MALSKISYDNAGIPKWQLALAIGGTLVVGAGIYYLLFKGNSAKKDFVSKDEEKSICKEDLEQENQSPLGKAQSCKNKGNKLFKEGKYEKAITCYDEAISACPSENKTDLSTFYQNRAAAYEQLKNWENVLRDCTAALELNIRYVKALQRRAKACEVLKDLEQALEDLTAVCIIESFQNQNTLLNVDRVLKELGSQHAKEAMENRKPVTPSKQFIKSYFDSFVEDPIFNSLYKEKEGDVDESENPPEKSSSYNGYLKAKQNLLEGNYSEILSCCCNELGNPLTPYKFEALLLRATMYILRGEYNKSLADLSFLTDATGVSLKVRVNALIKQGTIHMQQEKVEESLKSFSRASEVDPNNSDVFHHMGQINLLIGNVEGSIANFKKAVELNSNFPIAVVQKCYTDYRYAHSLGDQSKVAEVAMKFEEAIRNFPKCIECYILYAQVLADQNEYEKADQHYLRAIEIDPENPTNYVHRSLLYLQWKGDLAEARRLIMKALDIDDQCELAYENLATIEVQTGNLKKGIELFSKAISFSRTEMEMAHLFSLRDAAIAQTKVVEKLGITLPNFSSL